MVSGELLSNLRLRGGEMLVQKPLVLGGEVNQSCYCWADFVTGTREEGGEALSRKRGWGRAGWLPRLHRCEQGGVLCLSVLREEDKGMPSFLLPWFMWVFLK